MKIVTGSVDKGYPATDFPEYNTYYRLKRPVKLRSLLGNKNLVETDRVAFIAKGKKVSYIPNDLYQHKAEVVINGVEHPSLCSICTWRLTKLLNRFACGNPSGPGLDCATKFQATYDLESLPPEIQADDRQHVTDRRAMALLLQTPLWQLMWVASKNDDYYNEFILTTNHGRKERKIAAPKITLKKIQRALLDRLLVHHEILPCVKGFIKGCSIANNAEKHKGKELVLSLDIKDFFPSITVTRIVGLFKKLGYSTKLAYMIGKLTTYKDLLPQGAPTSPMISNMIAYRMDKVLMKIAASFDLAYTRYADDLTFSGNRRSRRATDRFIKIVKEIVVQQGFEINERKTKVMRKGARQTVTGLVVNEETNIRRNDYQELRAIIHNCENHGVESQAKKYYVKRGALDEGEQVPMRMVHTFYAMLKGKIAFIKVGNTARYEKLRTAFGRIGHP